MSSTRNDIVTQKVNVSGTYFEMSKHTWTCIINKIPDRFQEQIKQSNSEIFLERHPDAFQAILYRYQGNELHLPNEICPSVFRTELEFYGVDEMSLAKCCFTKYITYFDDQNVLKILEKDENDATTERERLIAMATSGGWSAIQARQWLILNEPFYSTAAKVYFAASAVVILVSLFVLVAGTHPDFQRSLNNDEWQSYFGDNWDKYKHHSEPGAEPENSPTPEGTTSIPHAESEFTPGQTSPEPEDEPVPIPENAFVRFLALEYIEYVCVALFSIDLIVRCVFCPRKYTLLISFLHWNDVFALAVMFAKYIVETLSPKEKYEASVLDILHCLQIVRVFRLIRLVKHFVGFRVLLYAFKASVKEMLLMSLFLVIAMLLFSAGAHFSGDKSFPSIPDAFWWTIVTMTTVGYGDVVPTTGVSKFIGAICAVSGVCLLAVIIPIFVNNFVLFYSYSKVWGKKHLDTEQEVVTNNNVVPKEDGNSFSVIASDKYVYHARM